MVVLRVMPLTSCGCNTMTEIITNNPKTKEKKTKEKTNKQTNKRLSRRVFPVTSCFFLLIFFSRFSISGQCWDGSWEGASYRGRAPQGARLLSGGVFLASDAKAPRRETHEKREVSERKGLGTRLPLRHILGGLRARSQADQFAGQFSQNQMPKIPAVFTDLCQSAWLSARSPRM